MVSLPEDLLIALNAAPGIGRAAICRLAIGQELPATGQRDCLQLAAHLGVPVAALRRAQEVRATARPRADRERQRAAKSGARILTLHSAAYPAMLRHLPLPPPVLYVRGVLPDGPAVSMVGARRASPYGLEAADTFSRALADAGLTVVSGMARGVDAAAHRGALAVGGITVAVLGCGVDVHYPRAHRRLAGEIAQAGAVISEFPCGCEPRPWHFPVRNRIIAALSLGTLVVEATLRSGSLITARHAMELGRDVLAVPGRIFDERALGPNSLIADGAVPARHPRDVVDALAWPESRLLQLPWRTAPAAQDAMAEADEPPPGHPKLPAVQRRIAAQLDRSEPKSGEELTTACDLTIDEVLAALLELELAGLARRCPGPAWTRRCVG